MPSLDVILVTPSMKGKVKAKDAKLFYESILEKWASIKDRFQKVTDRKVSWVLRSGLECELDKNLDFYMHGIGRSKPPWVVVLKPAEMFYVFVTFGASSEVHVGVVPDQTVRQLKEDLVEKFHVPANTQRLIFKGRQMEDYRELAHYGVNRDDRIECTMRLPGGSIAPYTKLFVDVSRNDLMTEIDTYSVPPDYPKWRVLYPGLVLEGKCVHSECPAAADIERTRAQKRYGVFDVIINKCACPECGTVFQPTTCGFHYCEWSFTGIKMVNNNPESVEGPWQSVPSGKYHYFDDSRGGGSVQWVRLLLSARPSRAFQKNCSLCNGVLGKDKRFVSPCDHAFHAACWEAYTTVGSQQNEATGGALCPVCRGNVPSSADMMQG